MTIYTPELQSLIETTITSFKDSGRVFNPTWLYIKQHSKTKQLYFGSTGEKDPVKYPGSGKHWKPHIKIHGKEHVETLWYCLFLDVESLVGFALMFSIHQNIVKSDLWLNLINETGCTVSTVKGMKHTVEQNKASSIRKKLYHASKSIEQKAEESIKLSIAHLEKKRYTNGTSIKVFLPGSEPIGWYYIPGKPIGGKYAKGCHRPKLECIHCGSWMNAGALARWHGDNCKLSPNA